MSMVGGGVSMMPLPVWLPGPMFLLGGLCPGASVQDGLCLGDLYPGVSVRGSLSRGLHPGISVQGFSVGRPARIRIAGCNHHTRTLSCLANILLKTVGKWRNLDLEWLRASLAPLGSATDHNHHHVCKQLYPFYCHRHHCLLRICSHKVKANVKVKNFF